MEKYKVCPNCSEHNSPALMECANCGTDLMAVKVVDENTQKQMEENKGEEMVRICECGAENPSGARKCSACGEEISDIIPTPRVTKDTTAPQPQAEEGAVGFLLNSIDGLCSFHVDKEYTVGRENMLKEYLGDKLYVSRTHAKLQPVPDGIVITGLSKTNPTYVNNKKLTDGESLTLCEGDEVGLGGCVINGKRQELAAYFKVVKC